jgi:hypothetical protein
MTSYIWPTWADILGSQFEHFENWGLSGAGNTCIFNSIIECDSRNKFTPDDLILIMWSGIARIDYYQQNSWGHLHNRFAKHDNTQPVSCPDGYEILSYPLFAAVDQYLNSKKLQYKCFTFTGYDSQSRAGTVYTDVLSKISHIKFKIESKKIKHFSNLKEVELLYKRLKGNDWPALDNILEKNYNALNDTIDKEIDDFLLMIKSDRHYQISEREVDDWHPLPIDHFDALKQIFPDISIDKSTTDWVLDISNKIQANEYYSYNKHQPSVRL